MSLPTFILAVTGKLKNDYLRLNAHFATIKTLWDGHVAGTADKHAAEHITYTGLASGAEVKTALNSLKSDINNVAAGGAEHDALVTAALVDSEGTDFGAGGLETYLDGRLDKWEIQTSAQLADIATNGIEIGTGTRYAIFAIHNIRTTIDYHAFEDWVTLNTTDTGLGYCSFDAKPAMNNALNQSHLVGYQARMIYNGSGNLVDYMHGYDTDMRHTGTGIIAKAIGSYIKDVGGTGPITDNYGLYIEPIVRGTGKNYAVYSAGGNSYFAGNVRTTGNIEFADVCGLFSNLTYNGGYKFINNGYGYGNITSSGKQIMYASNTGIAGGVAVLVPALSIDLSNANVLISKFLNLGNFTYASLPVGTSGDIAYCTNGRKIGETTGNGTGVMVCYSNAIWRTLATDTVVTI